MRSIKKIVIFVIGAAALATLIILYLYKRAIIVDEIPEYKTMGTLQLTSSQFEHNSKIPAKYTCDNENINPPLEIAGIPAGAKTLALIFDDPDAVDGKTWDHWILWNISPETISIAEGSAPPGAVQGKTSFGSNKYGGPCPPAWSGAHRYMFKLYALDVVLDLPPAAGKKELEEAMREHILDSAVLTGIYGRK